MARVALEQVGKRYGNVEAVRSVSLEIAHGEFVTLVGPSGCGKSTTLNLIAGLETPTSGTIRIDGEEVNALSPRERDVAMVFQSYALYPHLDVARNLAFPLEMSGEDRRTIEARVRETAALLGIEGLLKRRPRELSGGQRQRVALGRALVRRPKLFLFDEPLSNLDAALRTQMRGEIKKLHETLRATFIYVTHDQSEAMTLSDRVVVMKGGEVQQVGTPRELYVRPRNAFVASFFGSPAINLVSPETLGFPAAPGIRIGVRAEHLEVGEGEPPRGAVAGKVFLVEPMGAESWITVQLGEERVIARAPAELEVAPGAPVWVRAHPPRLLRFRDDTGERVDGG